jgi:hypothetical protein
MGLIDGQPGLATARVQDGVIRVITRRVTLKRESAGSSFRTLPDGAYLQLEIFDTGRGMSPQTQAKIFDPFFNTKSAGPGLGLAVVQGVVRSLGGAIHLPSEPDKGTTFPVLLPSAETTAAASNHVIFGDGQMAIPSQRGTVLVVEDEDHVRQGIVKMLRKTGFEYSKLPRVLLRSNFCVGKAAKCFRLHLEPPRSPPAQHPCLQFMPVRPANSRVRKPVLTVCGRPEAMLRMPVRHSRVLDL